MGTPGVFWICCKRTIYLRGKIKTVIIDEADEMLSQGFQELIYNIFQFIPKNLKLDCLVQRHPLGVT